MKAPAFPCPFCRAEYISASALESHVERCDRHDQAKHPRRALVDILDRAGVPRGEPLPLPERPRPALPNAREDRAWHRFLLYSPGIAPFEGFVEWEQLRCMAHEGHLNHEFFLRACAAMIGRPDAEHRFRLWVDEVKLAHRPVTKPTQLAFTL